MDIYNEEDDDNMKTCIIGHRQTNSKMKATLRECVYIYKNAVIINT